MSRKQCRRKVWAKVDPIKHAIEGAAVCPQDLLDKQRARELSSIEAMKCGAATLEDFRLMADMGNVCETMALDGVGREALEVIQAHEAALLRIAERVERTGVVTATAEDVAAMRDVYQYHDLQRQCVPRSAYERAIAKTAARVRSHAGDVVVL